MVQTPLIRHAVAAGWEYVPRAEAVALWKGEGECLLSCKGCARFSGGTSPAGRKETA